MLEKIEERIKQLTADLEQLVHNHNFINGALNELKAMKALYENVHEAVPAIEAVLPVVEEVAQAAEAIL